MSDLDAISHEYLTRTPDREIDSYLISVIADRVLENMRGGTVIELGIGDRVWTHKLLERFDHVTSVDGSQQLVDAMREEVDAAHWTGVVSYFEAYDAPQLVDVVLATYVLEHVDDPIPVLQRARRWVRDDGMLVVVVPNAGSLHRQLARAMQLVDDPTALGDADRRLGHKRVFTVDTLVQAIESCGFGVDAVEGFLAKTLPNSLLVHCSDEQLAGLVDVGRLLPVELAGALCVRAHPS